MLPTMDCWNALLETLTGLSVYKEVKPLPLEKLVDASFLQSLPSLKLPAAILTLRGLDQSIEGSARDRAARWSLVSVCKAMQGDAYVANLALYDRLVDGDGETPETRFFDRQILDDELTILGTHAMGFAIAHESLSVLEITFGTREAGER